MTVAITRTEHTAAVLRRLAGQSGDAAVVRRLLALALVLDGRKREDAARLAGMDWQALRDWVHRYNADCVAGLPTGTGAALHGACRLSRKWRSRAGCGPGLALDKVVRWRRVDIQARIAGLFGVALHERSVGKLLRRLGFSHVSVRPLHRKAVLVAQASFRLLCPRPCLKPCGPRARPSRLGSRTTPVPASKAL